MIPLPPRSGPDAGSVWVIGPPGVEARIVTPTGTFLLGMVLGRPSEAAPADDPSRSGPSTLSLREPSYHDRQLLASKFLSRPRPGDAVGNKEAADRANRVRPSEARNVTVKAEP